MKRILVPVDFSDCSLAAADVAITIAEKAGAEIRFLHFSEEAEIEVHVPRRDMAPVIPVERKKDVGAAKSNLDALVRKAERAGVPAKPVLALANHREWIEEYVGPYGIDQVIMGSHGIHRLKERMIGSTTLRFIRHTNVPVLVIKEKVKDFAIRKIVFASDFGTDWIKPFEAVINLGRLWKARLNLLYICTPDHFVPTTRILSDMRRFMHQFRKTEYEPHVCNAMDEAAGIGEFATENKVDVIALTTHGRTGLLRMLLPSVAEGLAKQVETPVLVINTKSLS